MNELQTKIYESLKICGQYNLAKDMLTKQQELDAIEDMINSGLIILRSRAIGCILADVV